MSALSIEVPFPVFQDRDGQPLENGYIWIGVANLNPQVNPVIAYFDSALTIPAAQPLRTINGYISNSGTPAQVYVDAVNFSILVQDSKGSMVYNFSDGTGISPDACGVIYNPPYTGGVAYPVCEKLEQTVSLNDFGADPTGVLDSSTALQLACAQRNEVHITNGTYKISTTPTITGPTNIIVHSSATLTGAGATALGYTSVAILQILNVKTSGTDFATQYIRRNADHTGGAPGYVSSALKAYTYVGANATNYEWAITGVVDNSSTAGQNTGIYAQGIKRSTGPTWGFVSEVIETTAVNNPTTGTVAQELDISVNGTDANFPFARIGSDLVVRKYDAAGANAQAGWGYRIQGDTGASIQIGFGIYTGMTATFGFDTSQGTILIAALRMAAGQAIAFDAASNNKLSYDGTGLNYVVSGTGKVRLNSNGSILLVGAVNQLNIQPDTSTGATSVSLAANKPGTTSAASPRWIRADIDGDIYWIPAWLN